MQSPPHVGKFDSLNGNSELHESPTRSGVQHVPMPPSSPRVEPSQRSRERPLALSSLNDLYNRVNLSPVHSSSLQPKPKFGSSPEKSHAGAGAIFSQLNISPGKGKPTAVLLQGPEQSPSMTPVTPNKRPAVHLDHQSILNIPKCSILEEDNDQNDNIISSNNSAFVLSEAEVGVLWSAHQLPPFQPGRYNSNNNSHIYCDVVEEARYCAQKDIPYDGEDAIRAAVGARLHFLQRNSSGQGQFVLASRHNHAYFSHSFTSTRALTTFHPDVQKTSALTVGSGKVPKFGLWTHGYDICLTRVGIQANQKPFYTNSQYSKLHAETTYTIILRSLLLQQYIADKMNRLSLLSYTDNPKQLKLKSEQQTAIVQILSKHSSNNTDTVFSAILAHLRQNIVQQEKRIHKEQKELLRWVFNDKIVPSIKLNKMEDPEHRHHHHHHHHHTVKRSSLDFIEPGLYEQYFPVNSRYMKTSSSSRSRSSSSSSNIRGIDNTRKYPWKSVLPFLSVVDLNKQWCALPCLYPLLTHAPQYVAAIHTDSRNLTDQHCPSLSQYSPLELYLSLQNVLFKKHSRSVQRQWVCSGTPTALHCGPEGIFVGDHEGHVFRIQLLPEHLPQSVFTTSLQCSEALHHTEVCSALFKMFSAAHQDNSNVPYLASPIHKAHTGPVLAVLPVGSKLATVSEDGSMKVWDNGELSVHSNTIHRYSSIDTVYRDSSVQILVGNHGAVHQYDERTINSRRHRVLNDQVRSGIVSSNTTSILQDTSDEDKEVQNISAVAFGKLTGSREVLSTEIVYSAKNVCLRCHAQGFSGCRHMQAYSKWLKKTTVSAASVSIDEDTAIESHRSGNSLYKRVQLGEGHIASKSMYSNNTNNNNTLLSNADSFGSSPSCISSGGDSIDLSRKLTHILPRADSTCSVIAAGSADGQVHILHADSGHVLNRLRTSSQNSAVTQLTLCPHSQVLGVVHADHSVVFLDARIVRAANTSQPSTCCVPITNSWGTVLGLRFLYPLLPALHNHVLLVAEMQLSIYHLGNLAKPKYKTNSAGKIHAYALHPAGTLVATVVDDVNIHIYKTIPLQTPIIKLEAESKILHIEFLVKRDYGWLLTTHQDGSVNLWH